MGVLVAWLFAHPQITRLWSSCVPVLKHADVCLMISIGSRSCNLHQAEYNDRLPFRGAHGVAHLRTSSKGRVGGFLCEATHPSFYNEDENQNDEMAGDSVSNWKHHFHCGLHHLDYFALLLDQRTSKVRVFIRPGQPLQRP